METDRLPLRRIARILAAALSLNIPFAALAQACHARSPAHKVALLELYTSEGCSSCPPADRFVAGLRAAGLDASRVVPLALHVDYWDYIGWKDRFGQPAFAERQRALAALASSRTIYTPEIFVAGHELRDWRGALDATVREINRQPAQATIELTLGKSEGQQLPLRVNARANGAASLYLALYESGLRSDVRAGENGGVVLHHDYVVRDWVGPLPFAARGGGAFSPVLAIPEGARREQLGVAAFVQDARGEVLQALALPLCGA